MTTTADKYCPPALWNIRHKGDPAKRTPEQWEEARDYLLSYFTEAIEQKIKWEIPVKPESLRDLDRKLWTLEKAVLETVKEISSSDRSELHIILDDLIFYRQLGQGVSFNYTPLYVYDEETIPVDDVIENNLYSFLYNAVYLGSRPIYHRLAQKIGMKPREE